MLGHGAIEARMMGKDGRPPVVGFVPIDDQRLTFDGSGRQGHKAAMRDLRNGFTCCRGDGTIQVVLVHGIPFLGEDGSRNRKRPPQNAAGAAAQTKIGVRPVSWWR